MNSVSWTIAKENIHDTCGVDHPELYTWFEFEGVYYPAEKLDKQKLTPEQTAYLLKVDIAMTIINNGAKFLNQLWAEEPAGIDLNDFLHQGYPFDKSFDAIGFELEEWAKDWSKRYNQVR